jgi:hypothetical protein
LPFKQPFGCDKNVLSPEKSISSSKRVFYQRMCGSVTVHDVSSLPGGIYIVHEQPLKLGAILEHLEIKQNELLQSLLSDGGAVTGAGPMERFAANWLQPWLNVLLAIAGGVSGSRRRRRRMRV